MYRVSVSIHVDFRSVPATTPLSRGSEIHLEALDHARKIMENLRHPMASRMIMHDHHDPTCTGNDLAGIEVSHKRKLLDIVSGSSCSTCARGEIRTAEHGAVDNRPTAALISFHSSFQTQCGGAAIASSVCIQDLGRSCRAEALQVHC